MSRNHVDDEFIAVRVQDPRIQNEGSWNSYVDYKIFLHTNSKAFTAKTSCVRRRYSEFEWLKKKLQKNAGLVPVPDLPGKSLYFSNEDFLEKRRRGLQAFLNKVVHMTVCLSDSQLHLFMQTQLPISHIQDCVQGLTPYSVTDAILTYASSNRGLAQAQEENSNRNHSLTISYESTESPAPHRPNAACRSESPRGESDPLEDILELCEQDSDETLHKEKPSIRISQGSNQDQDPTQATFYLGETSDDSGSLSSADQMERRSCLIQTPVEVHSAMGTDGGLDMFEEEHVSLKTEKTEDDSDRSIIRSESVNSEGIFGLKENKERVQENHVASEDICCENPVLQNQVNTQVSESHAVEFKSDVQVSDESGSRDETPPPSGNPEETLNVNADGECQHEDERESDEDCHSLPSSNESIVKCSEEESVCEETEDLLHTGSSSEDVQNWSVVEASSRNGTGRHTNGCVEEKEDHVTNMSDFMTSSEFKPADGDLTENSDFSILESSCLLAADAAVLSSPSRDGSEKNQGRGGSVIQVPSTDWVRSLDSVGQQRAPQKHFHLKASPATETLPP